MSCCAPKQDPAPSSKTIFITADLFYVPCDILEIDCASASFLNPSCMIALMNILCGDCRACQFLLEHLLEVIFVVSKTKV
jgi:hypothetical protein